MFIKKFLSSQPWNASAPDWASLMIRFTFGGLLSWNHGYSKFSDLIGGATDFPDPIGIGAYPSFVMTVFVELVCCIMLALGLFTRFSAIALVFTMMVIAFVIHGPDPLGDKEHALLYLFGGVAVFLMGGGKYSLDARLFKR